MDTLDFLGVVDGAGEEDRELELDSSMKIVGAGRSDLDDLAEVEVRLREVDRDSDRAARVAPPPSPKNLNNRSRLKTKKTNCGFALFFTAP